MIPAPGVSNRFFFLSFLVLCALFQRGAVQEVPFRHGGRGEGGGGGGGLEGRWVGSIKEPNSWLRFYVCEPRRVVVGWLVGCLASQQHANVSQGRICPDIFTCCHTEIEVADQTFHLTQSQYTDTGPTSPSADPIWPGAWQGSHWSANV